MSKTIELANANGWDSKRLGDKLDYAFQPVMNGIETSQHETTKDALGKIVVALADCKEALPHASIEDVCDTALERIKRSKAYSRTAKMLVGIALMLWRVGFTTAEAIDGQLARNKWTSLADRSVLLQSSYDLISRLYGAGVRCKLADVRQTFRGLFNTVKNPHDVKKAIAEAMLGFPIAERTFELWVIGQTEKVMLTDGTTYNKHVPSHLERYETALSKDATALRAGTAQDTASKLRLSADDIRAENTVWLKAEAEQAEKAKAEALAKAEAKQKAEDEAKQALAYKRTEEAKQKREERAQSEVDKLGEQLSAGTITESEYHAKCFAVFNSAGMTVQAEEAELMFQDAQKRKAEADKAEASIPENVLNADQQRKAEAKAKRLANKLARQSTTAHGSNGKALNA